VVGDHPTLQRPLLIKTPAAPVQALVAVAGTFLQPPRPVQDVALETRLNSRPQREDKAGPNRGQHLGELLGRTVVAQRAFHIGRYRAALVQAPIDRILDVLAGGGPDPVQLGVDVAHRATRVRSQEIGHRLGVARQREQRPEVVGFRDALERGSMPAQPGGMGGGRRRHHRPRDLDDLIDRRDRKPTPKQVGNGELERDHVAVRPAADGIVSSPACEYVGRRGGRWFRAGEQRR
jgi:hypothetical protein